MAIRDKPVTKTIPVIFDGAAPAEKQISGLLLYEEEQKVSSSDDDLILDDADVEKGFDPNQPRHPKGSPKGGQWADTSGPSTEDQKSGLQMYLELVASVSPTGEWFLKNGKSFTIDDETFIGGEAQQCYKNAFGAMLENEFESEEDLTYVEGYMSVHGVPIHHAWLVTNDGKVRDVTLRDESRSYVTEYFGVPMDWEYVQRETLRQKVYGLTVGGPSFARVIKDGNKALKKGGV